MPLAATRNPFSAILLRFALLIGGLGRRVDERHQHGQIPDILFAAVMERLDRMVLRLQRAVRAFEARRPRPSPSAACQDAAAAARAERAALAATGANPRRTKRQGFRLPQGFGWLSDCVPEAEAYAPEVRAILNDPALAELLGNAPAVRRTLLSLCNMLGIGTFMVAPAHVAALGRYEIGRGWHVRKEPAPRARDSASPDRRQNE